MDRDAPVIDATTREERRASHKRLREATNTPVLIDLSSDDDSGGDDRCDGQVSGNSCVNGNGPQRAPLHIIGRGASLAAGGHAQVRAPARYGYDPEESDDESTDEDEGDDGDDDDDSIDSDDSEDDGSDLKDFIVSDDEDDEEAIERGMMARGVDSEEDFVPSDDGDDDDDDTPLSDGEDAISGDDNDGNDDSTDMTESLSPSQTALCDSVPNNTTAGGKPTKVKTSHTGAKPSRPNGNKRAKDVGADGDDDVVIVGVSSASSAVGSRPTKRARLDESEEVPAIDPTNIVSGKRSRRATQRYMDRRFMKYMVRDVPADQIAAVFDDEDEYFQSGISLTDSSEEDSAEGTGQDDDDDLDSSDYEELDALSSSARPKPRRRAEARQPSEGATARPAQARARGADDGAFDLSRPPSTVAALLRSLAAQPGGIRPSVASPRSAPTARTPLLP
nr:hypothetical protein [Pandoravirus massiliensis]